jgi:hypothetical protein
MSEVFFHSYSSIFSLRPYYRRFSFKELPSILKPLLLSFRYGARISEGGIKIVFTYFERDFSKILLNFSRFISVHLFVIKYNFSGRRKQKKNMKVIGKFNNENFSRGGGAILFVPPLATALLSFILYFNLISISTTCTNRLPLHLPKFIFV